MRAVVAVLIVVLLPTAAFAQAKGAPVKTAQRAAPPPSAPPSAAGSAAVAAGAAPAPAAAVPQAGTPPTPPARVPENFSYQPDGRRDPFLSLLGAGAQTDAKGSKGAGAASFTLAEISVRGIVQTKGRLLAMAETPDGKTYLIHAGDKLADGIVKNVTSEGLVFIQDINDPLSVQKQREVRKLLRSLEDAK